MDISNKRLVCEELALIRANQVTAMTGLSRSSIYRMMECGEFPRAVPLSASTAHNAPVAWVLAEVRQWVQQRIAQRDTQQQVGGAQ